MAISACKNRQCEKQYPDYDKKIGKVDFLGKMVYLVYEKETEKPYLTPWGRTLTPP